jgi:protoporphyrin/coproporphyrin ferrochelatase
MTGILIIQLGTPDAPTGKALKPYLRQFLSDPRVIEVPKIIWWPLLHGVILLTRPRKSAEKYARIWDPVTGSPLMHWTKTQTALLQERFGDIPVRFGMQVGNPRLDDTIRQMIKEGFTKIIALPMYPQYSATTTASATDILFSTLLKERRVPAVRVVPPHYDHPAYIDAMVQVIHDDLAKLDWEPEHFVFSFHGIPKKYAQRGDPYATHCVRTTQLLVEKLGWRRDQWTRTFQSRFGPQAWLKPYTDDVLEALAKKGVKRVMCILPGFTADCLETVDEIGHESEEVFHEHGGEKLRACPCLNDHPKWIDALETILREEGGNWLTTSASPTLEMARG